MKKVFIFSFLYFLSFALLFLFIALPHNPQVGMMGYDTGGYIEYPPMMLNFENIFHWNLRHPILALYYLPAVIFDYILNLFDINIRWILFILNSDIYMALTITLLYRLLENLNIDKFISAISVIMFCSFAYVILFSIQVESFVVSMFFLLLMLNVFIDNKKNVVADNIVFMGLAGATSTNGLKLFMSFAFQAKSLKEYICRCLTSVILFCILILPNLYNLYERIFVMHQSIKYVLLGDSLNYRGSDLSKLYLLLTNFLSEPLLFHNVNGVIYSKESILLPSYENVFPFFIVCAILLLFIISIIWCRKEKIAKLFFATFFFDIIMHFVIGYGIEEGQLFCAHWFFYIPIFIALLCNKLKQIKKHKIVLFTISLIITYMFIYNTFCYVNSLF